MSYDPAGGQQPGGQGWQGGQPPYPPPGGGFGQQPAGWGPPPAGGGGLGGPAESKSFFAALFDYSFNSFATPGLIKIMYIVGSVLIVLGWLGYTITAFSLGSNLGGGGAVIGILTLIFGGIFALFLIATLRVSLEFYYAVVRMSEDIHNRR